MRFTFSGILTAALVAASLPAAAQQATAPAVTPQDIAAGLKDPGRWLTYGGDYSGQRHSPLTQLTPANVGKLQAQWTFQTGTVGSFQTTPILIDGVLYATGFGNNAWAIDARTGRQIWRYRRDLPNDLHNCCGSVNRGFAVLGDKLFMTTIDAHLLALDMRTGDVVWDVTMEDYKVGYSATVAPLVVKNHVIVGIAGAEFGIRGFIDSYDPDTGKRAVALLDRRRPERPGRQHLAVHRRVQAGRRIDLGDRHLRSRGEHGLLRHRQSRARLLQREPRRGQPLYLLPRGARRRHGQAEVALSVHPARSPRLGFDPGARAGGAADQRSEPEGGDVRQPERLLLHARSRRPAR